MPRRAAVREGSIIIQSRRNPRAWSCLPALQALVFFAAPLCMQAQEEGAAPAQTLQTVVVTGTLI
jgi:hypothetical protein